MPKLNESDLQSALEDYLQRGNMAPIESLEAAQFYTVAALYLSGKTLGIPAPLTPEAVKMYEVEYARIHERIRYHNALVRAAEEAFKRDVIEPLMWDQEAEGAGQDRDVYRQNWMTDWMERMLDGDA